MWKKFHLGWLMVSILLCAPNAVAQMSRHAFEAVRDETLIVDTEDGQTLRGELRHIDDERAVVLTKEGEIYEVSLSQVKHLRVDRAQPKAPESTAQERKEVEAHRYLSEPSSTGYFDTSEQREIQNPYLGASQPTVRDPDGLRLTSSDYARYSEMLEQSRNKRVVGWSFFATGAGFLMLMALQIRDARAANLNPRVGAIAAVGSITSAIGLPVAIAGRQQYRRAAEFAEQAALNRHAIEREAAEESAQRFQNDDTLFAPNLSPNASEARESNDPAAQESDDLRTMDGAKEEEVMHAGSSEE